MHSLGFINVRFRRFTYHDVGDRHGVIKAEGQVAVIRAPVAVEILCVRVEGARPSRGSHGVVFTILAKGKQYTRDN